MEISEPLTWDQICERYPDQHVMLVDIEWIGQHTYAPRSARVVAAGVTADEASERAEARISAETERCVRFTGPPEEVVMFFHHVVVDDELRDDLHARR